MIGRVCVMLWGRERDGGYTRHAVKVALGTQVMLCYVTLCHAMLCYAMLCCAVLCCAMYP